MERDILLRLIHSLEFLSDDLMEFLCDESYERKEHISTLSNEFYEMSSLLCLCLSTFEITFEGDREEIRERVNGLLQSFTGLVKDSEVR